MNMHSFVKQKAFSLVELLLVLGVLATLLIAAFVIYPKVRDANIAKNEAANILNMRAAVHTLYASKNYNYTGLNTVVANQAKMFPPSMNQGNYSTDTITSSWGGAVKVSTHGQDTTFPYQILANRFFYIEYQDVPSTVCVDLISQLAPQFVKLQINEKEVTSKPTNSNQSSLDISLATQRCSEGKSKIVFYSL